MTTKPNRAAHDANSRASMGSSRTASKESLPPALIAAVILAMFMAVLDQTIVGTALPSIAADIDGAHHYTWIITSYLLTSTIFLPIFGALSDRFGHKRLLLLGISVFVAASVACGLAGDVNMLIAARAVQGIGAAVLVTVPLALMLDKAPPGKSVQIQSAFGAIIAVSLLVGPYLGGLISDRLSWHWVFFINVPVAAVVMIIVLCTLREAPRERPGRLHIDWAGFLVFSASICLILLGFSNKGGSAGTVPRSWSEASVWPLVTVGLIGVVLFVAIEWRVSNPIIAVRTLKDGRMAPTLLASFAVAFLMYPAIIFMPRYFQSALGTSATESAMRTFPLMVGLVIGMVLLGAVVKMTGQYRWPLIAFGIAAITGLMLLRDLSGHTGAQIYIGLALLGLGIGPMISGLMMVAQHSLDRRDVGLATSTVTFFRQIGGTVSLAFGGGIFAASIQRAGGVGEDPSQSVAPAVSDVIIQLGVVGAVVVIVCVLLVPTVELNADSTSNAETRS